MPLIPLTAIQPDPANVRASLGDLATLASSLRELGMVQPLTLRPLDGGYIVVDGHRRFEAARLAEMSEVPAEIISPDLQQQEVIAMQAAANMVRRPMSQVEQWRAVARLKAEGYDDAGAAAALGLGERQMARMRLLGRLPAPILDAIEAQPDRQPEFHQLRAVNRH